MIHEQDARENYGAKALGFVIIKDKTQQLILDNFFASLRLKIIHRKDAKAQGSVLQLFFHLSEKIACNKNSGCIS